MLFLCVLAVLCTLGASQRTIISSLTVTNGAGDGHWFKDEFCPIGTFATGFQILCEEDRGSLGDDTALNGMTVFCEPREAIMEHRRFGMIESFYGTWGYWRELFHCPAGMYMVQFKLRVEEDGGFSPDDTAVNNVRFTCRGFDNTDWDEITGDGETWGKWGDFSDDCPLGSAICGMATEYKVPLIGDNVGVTNYRFYCCEV